MTLTHSFAVSANKRSAGGAAVPNRHPCYGEEAQHVYARMHLAVAPKCNISCNYCYRKYDCANESRPGVTSEVLKPCDAVRHVAESAARLPQLSVIGIAGPGDPLANPERTFETFRGAAEALPDAHLCLSTNGLALLDHLDEIIASGVSHLTVTINAIDPEIGQHIYHRVFWNGVSYRGRRAAELLIFRQLEGLKAAVASGITCKVNTVLIPGVNDTHVPEISAVVRKLGAVLHNVMPHIPVEGSRFTKLGIGAPSDEMLQKTRRLCGERISVMTHCRQCRADAVGLLTDSDPGSGKDAQHAKGFVKAGGACPTVSCSSKKGIAADTDSHHAAEASPLPPQIGGVQPQAEKPSATGVRAAVCSEGGNTVNRHFGHASQFYIFELLGGKAQLIEMRESEPYCNGRSDCAPDKEELLASLVRLLHDCTLLFSSGIGDAPGRELKAAGIVPVTVKRGTSIDRLTEEYARYAAFLSPSEVAY
ncbi:nitrogenase cofactor biosynthesis protein NifB [Gorillibacterium massiliense]|uniref:nitrogenase cofactor biosynthesis protein NifB n=1 Tax=Gorillibacterium massiliense TaxID=1280390 RepID=UPI0004AFCCF8|nr:nitrogenase cofactor biosynthesis protein NifB [Gorillibacterium massiliense]